MYIVIDQLFILLIKIIVNIRITYQWFVIFALINSKGKYMALDEKGRLVSVDEELMVKDLFIQGTKETPEIICKRNDGEILIKGFCILSNPKEFLAPLYLWLENFYKLYHPSNLLISFRLSYINGCSEKCIYDFPKFAERNCPTNTNLNIRCFYEEDDIDMYEWSKELKSVFKIPVSVLKTV